ncbi:MAG: tail fiber domain-containing protein [Melioribacteraceae bacterium]|nr:tail fiber domain-containing protein [Melioribacteraceae bacterium]
MQKTIIIVLFTFILTNIYAQENKNQKIQKVDKALSPQASASAIVKFKGLNTTLLEISGQIDNNGEEFGVIDLTPATDDPNDADSVKNRLWKDPNETLLYGGDFQALGSINASSNITANNFTASNKITADAFRLITGGGAGKYLQSDANGNASWATLSGGGSGSINGLSDGKAVSNTGSVYLGEGAGTNDDSPGITDPSNNTGFGINALNKNGLVASQRGEKNTAIGFEALKNLDNNNGNENTALGYQAHFNNVSGYQNTALGNESMYGYNGGFGNTAVGYQSLKGGNSSSTGQYNIALGYAALKGNITGNYNIAIGYKAGETLTGSDQLIIQNRQNAARDPLIWGSFAPSSVKVHINVSDITTRSERFYVNGSAGGTGPWINASDKRLKNNISTIPNSLDKVKKLRGVNFKWNDTKNNPRGLQMGFIAQEAKNIIPEVVNEDDEYMSMQYAPITALLVEAIKEQQKIIDQQNSKINSQEERLSNLESLLEGKRFTAIKK